MPAITPPTITPDLRERQSSALNAAIQTAYKVLHDLSENSPAYRVLEVTIERAEGFRDYGFFLQGLDLLRKNGGCGF